MDQVVIEIIISCKEFVKNCSPSIGRFLLKLRIKVCHHEIEKQTKFKRIEKRKQEQATLAQQVIL